MPTSDGLTEQTAEVQDALRHELEQSGAAGTGPSTLPPPADIASEQQRSTAPGDESYSNTLRIDLYRDADGKVWTQPGAGHREPDISMRIRRWQGKWHVVTEHRKVTRRRQIGEHIVTESERDAGATSGAPVSELGSVERFEQFAPQSAREAIRQTLAALQAKGAIYVYDPNVPVPQHTAGVLANALFAFAALAVVAAIAAFAGVGPFASAPAAAAQNGTIQVGATAAISAAPVAASAATSACGPGGSQNGTEDVSVSGAVTAHVTQDCGQGPVGGAPHCNPVQTAPYGTNGQQSYTYDWYGGFYAGGIEYELHFPGSGIGSTFSVQFPRDPTAPNRGHVTMISYENFVPASVWQSPDGAPTGAISWTPTTVTMSNVTLTSQPAGPKPAAPVTLNGTWAVHCGGAAAAISAAPSVAATAAPAVTSVGAAVTTPARGGSLPWGPGLAVLAVASAASAFVMKQRARSGVPDCSKLRAAVAELEQRGARYKVRADEAYVRAYSMGRSQLAADGVGHSPEIKEWADAQAALNRVQEKLARTRGALDRCLAGMGADESPGDDPVRAVTDDGFNPLPPADPASDPVFDPPPLPSNEGYDDGDKTWRRDVD